MKKYFEDLKVILSRIPDERGVNFEKAALTAKTLVDIFGSLSYSAKQNVREDMYSLATALCIYLEAASEEKGLARSFLNSVFDDLFNKIRPEVRRMRQEQIEERKQREPAVGEVFKCKGHKYLCVLDETDVTSSDQDPCERCAFNNTMRDTCDAENLHCTDDCRSDEKNVIFVHYEPAVGSVYEQDGKSYRVEAFVPESIEKDTCEGCPFAPTEDDPNCHCQVFCSEDYRSDGQNIRFTEIRED